MTRAYEGDGVLVNSGEFNGMENRSAVNAITEKLAKNNMGHCNVTSKSYEKFRIVASHIIR